MHILDWIDETKAVLDEFEDHWYKAHNNNPDKFQLSMPSEQWRKEVDAYIASDQTGDI